MTGGNKFSRSSLLQLATCDTRLQCIAHEVLLYADIGIACGHRNRLAQNKAFAEHKSTKQWPNSVHNTLPSPALDFIVFTHGIISWDVRRYIHVAGMFIAVAGSLGVVLRWGGNWDQDDEIITDQTLQDYGHIEVCDGR